MHGLINRAIQCFLRDTYGVSQWVAIAQEARLGFENFEPMLHYEATLTEDMLAAASKLLNRPRDVLLEDMGTYLVSHPNLEALRRLLRFGGADFRDFLHSMEDLRGRGRLALPDLDLPELELFEKAPDMYLLRCRAPMQGAGLVIMGLLRAMADDYGALVLLDYHGAGPDGEMIGVHLAEAGFAEGRSFDLAARMG